MMQGQKDKFERRSLIKLDKTLLQQVSMLTSLNPFDESESEIIQAGVSYEMWNAHISLPNNQFPKLETVPGAYINHIIIVLLKGF